MAECKVGVIKVTSKVIKQALNIPENLRIIGIDFHFNPEFIKIKVVGDAEYTHSLPEGYEIPEHYIDDIEEITPSRDILPKLPKYEVPPKKNVYP